MTLRERLYTSRLRSYLRRAGGVRAWSCFAGRGKRLVGRQQERFPGGPSVVPVSSGNLTVRMEALDETEFRRIGAHHEERSILRVIIDRLGPGGTYWDVGASIGLYSVLIGTQLAQRDGRVVAFEPEPRSFERLMRNVSLNDLRGTVEAHRLALGARRQQRELGTAQHASAGTHSLLEGYLPPDAGGNEIVEVVTGDEFRAERGLAVPEVVKIDVEGAELDVLQGLRETIRSPRCRAVICEVHFAILEKSGRGHDVAQLLALLDASGLRRRRWIDRSHVVSTR